MIGRAAVVADPDADPPVLAQPAVAAVAPVQGRSRVPPRTGKGVEGRAGDLTPHLTGAQRTAMKKLLDDLLLKAQGAVS